MGQLVVSSATGQGSASLGGQVNVTEVAVKLVTLATEATVAGVSPVRRLRKQAWYGVGVTPDGGPLVGVPIVMWQKFQEMECEDHYPLVPFALADTVYWDVFPGGTIMIEVDW